MKAFKTSSSNRAEGNSLKITFSPLFPSFHYCQSQKKKCQFPSNSKETWTSLGQTRIPFRDADSHQSRMPFLREFQRSGRRDSDRRKGQRIGRGRDYSPRRNGWRSGFRAVSVAVSAGCSCSCGNCRPGNAGTHPKGGIQVRSRHRRPGRCSRLAGNPPGIAGHRHVGRTSDRRNWEEERN